MTPKKYKNSLKNDKNAQRFFPLKMQKKLKMLQICHIRDFVNFWGSFCKNPKEKYSKKI